MGATLAVNRRARHDYSIEDTLEAGIVLTGTEIKSLRDGKGNLSAAFAKIDGGEAWLINAHIAPWANGNVNNHEPRRDRKLHQRSRASQAGTRRRAWQAVARPPAGHQGPRFTPRHGAAAGGNLAPPLKTPVGAGFSPSRRAASTGR